MDKYKKINSFNQIIKIAQSEIHNEYKLNFNVKVKFDIELINKEIESIHSLAVSFQKKVCPSNLYMNHGTYIHKKDNGIQNIIDELKTKQNSNRAIISLISQEDIVGSGDNPIPSFMILQFSIENSKDLYVSVYFRALEVTRFLEVNIEEIRIIIESLKKEFLNINKVFLNIIAFRAYKKENISVLERAKLDQLSQIKIFGILKKEPAHLVKLLEEKSKTFTVIEYESYSEILECIEDDNSQEEINKAYKKPIVKNILRKLIEISKELKKDREKSSHSKQINKSQKKYKKKLDDLIKELRNDS